MRKASYAFVQEADFERLFKIRGRPRPRVASPETLTGGWKFDFGREHTSVQRQYFCRACGHTGHDVTLFWHNQPVERMPRSASLSQLLTNTGGALPGIAHLLRLED
jgi:hypothetical protein